MFHCYLPLKMLLLNILFTTLKIAFSSSIFSLRTYDTIKACRWNFFKFSWVVHYRKYVNSGLKIGGHHALFWVLEVKRYYKNITKIKHKGLFLFTFLVSFFMTFLAQQLIYTINIWLTLCLAHFLSKIIH